MVRHGRTQLVELHAIDQVDPIQTAIRVADPVGLDQLQAGAEDAAGALFVRAGHEHIARHH
ncbi:hypothetical protein D3C73_1631960 [compost metagenome]